MDKNNFIPSPFPCQDITFLPLVIKVYHNAFRIVDTLIGMIKKKKKIEDMELSLETR